MMHTTKLILVPATPASTNAQTDLKKVLDDLSLDQESKLKKCQEIISKYTKSTPNSVNTNDHILASIPKKYRNNAQLLLEFVNRNPSLKFNNLGEMVYEGKTIPGSNLVDLIHDFSRQRKSKKPATGASFFIKALQKHNIPNECIGNPDRWALLDNQHIESIDENEKKWDGYYK